MPRATVPADVDLGRVWTGVAAHVWRRRPGPLERAAGWLLRSPGLARALVATPSLLLAWIIATVVVLFAGAARHPRDRDAVRGAARADGRGGGHRHAYGPGIDPAWELSQSMAVSDRMVLLVRALAVFALNAALGLAASAASGAAAALTFGWLVPMTAVCALALAVATLSRSAIVGVAAGVAGWVITVLSGAAAGGQLTRRSPIRPWSFPTWPSRPSAARSSVRDPDPERNVMNVDITDLSRRFGRTQAVAGVSLQAGAGCSGCWARTGRARRRCCG